MRNSISIFVLFVILLSHTACEEEIEFNDDSVQPKIVINAFLTNDSLVSAHVSLSRFFLSSSDKFEFLPDAVVDLFVNNVFKETLTYAGFGMFRGTFIPQIGDHLRISVKATGFPTAESTTIIQPKSNIVSLDTTLVLANSQEMFFNGQLVGHYRNYAVNVKLLLRDTPHVNNHYRLVVKKLYYSLEGGVLWENEHFISFKLEGFESGGSSIFNFLDDSDAFKQEFLLTDEMFNGKDIQLQLQLDNLSRYESLPEFAGLDGENTHLPKIMYKINVQTIPRDTYLYLVTRNSSRNIMNGIFAEPVQVYNNISNGIGVFAAFTNHVRIIQF